MTGVAGKDEALDKSACKEAGPFAAWGIIVPEGVTGIRRSCGSRDEAKSGSPVPAKLRFLYAWRSAIGCEPNEVDLPETELLDSLALPEPSVPSVPPLLSELAETAPVSADWDGAWPASASKASNAPASPDKGEEEPV
jgi:hypothetical protein